MLADASIHEVSTMLVELDIHSNVAVYMQIENEIQFAVASGKLKAGDKHWTDSRSSKSKILKLPPGDA